MEKVDVVRDHLNQVLEAGLTDVERMARHSQVPEFKLKKLLAGKVIGYQDVTNLEQALNDLAAYVPSKDEPDLLADVDVKDVKPNGEAKAEGVTGAKAAKPKAEGVTGAKAAKPRRRLSDPEPKKIEGKLKTKAVKEKKTKTAARNPARAKGDFFNDQLITKVKAPEKGKPFSSQGTPASLRDRYDLISAKVNTVGALCKLQKELGFKNTRPAIRKLIQGGHITVK
jgi:hypothetical protein